MKKMFISQLNKFGVTKKHRILLALSGGVDSAVLATIVANQKLNLRSVFVRHNQKHSNVNICEDVLLILRSQSLR